jgi:hypothetical protein
VTLSPLTLEERSELWGTLQPKYRVSLTYDVRVVYVDSERLEQLAPVSRRSIDFAVPEGVS